MSGLVLVLEDDLLFGSRLERGLSANGYQTRVATDVRELSEALKAAPVLILINSGSRRIAWPRMVQLAKARRTPPLAPVLAYGPHVDLNLREQALDAGCDAVVARSVVANNLASLLKRYAWKPDLSACDERLPSGIIEGIDQFSRSAFYACHGSIELVWVDEQRDVRLMYQGMLQISVAFYHVQNGNWAGMVKMMARGKGKLLPFLPRCQAVDLARLLGDVERCETKLRGLGAERLTGFDAFPSIHAVV